MMEIEAKFTARRTEVLDRLAALSSLAGFALGETTIVEQADTYLDTPRDDVAAGGYFCRRRISDGRTKIALKNVTSSVDGRHRRQELEVEVGGDGLTPGDWPASPARDLVVELVGDGLLEPLFELRQRRALRPVRRAGTDAEIAELSLDRVAVLAPAGERRFFEVEVELRDGSEGDLDQLAAALRDEWHLAPQSQSKYARALTLLGGRRGAVTLTPDDARSCALLAGRDDAYGRRARALLAVHHGRSQTQAAAESGLSERRVRHWATTYRLKGMAVFPARVLAAAGGGAAAGGAAATPSAGDRPGAAAPARPIPVLTFDARSTMAEAAAAVLAEQFRRMLDHEEGTRLGDDPEELHDMRVATRRMRAAVRVFDGHLDPKAMRPFVKALRGTGRALGTVRDLDVFRIKTDHYLESLPDDRRDELEPLLQAWQAEREHGRVRLLAHLDGARYAHFVERFPDALADPERLAPATAERAEPVARRVLHVLPTVLFARAAAVWAFDDALAGGDAPLWRYHQLRITAKGLRYTLEFFEKVLGPGAKPLIRKVKDLQDHLGDLQDAVVSSEIMRTYLTYGTWRPPERKRRDAAEAAVAPGVAAYLAVRQAETQELVRTFPPVWDAVGGAAFRRALAELVAALEAR